MTADARHRMHGVDTRNFSPPLRLSDFKLVAFDMDSTLISIECIDEIAAAAGRKAEVAAITEAAMNGQFGGGMADYRDSLHRRLALLRGASPSSACVCSSGCSWTFHAPMRCRCRTASSLARCCRKPGARLSTVQRSAARCWKWPA